MTKDEIATVLNARLKRAETATTLAEEIRSGLTYLSGAGLWGDLRTSATAALVAGNTSFAKPANFRQEDRITLTYGTVVYRPLLKTDFDAILAYRGAFVGQSQPMEYCKVGANFELKETCDKSYTATIYYWQYHPDQDTILFGEPFREAVFNAVMYKYCEGKKLIQEGVYYKAICDREISLLRDSEEDLLSVKAHYKDLG